MFFPDISKALLFCECCAQPVHMFMRVSDLVDNFVSFYRTPQYGVDRARSRGGEQHLGLRPAD